MSLGQLLVQHDRRAEARDVVAEAYRGFTEGFATPDLRRARALLEKLAA
jgi:predicted ATPase